MIKKKGLSVRQTEELVRKMYLGNHTKTAAKPAIPNAYKKIEDNILNLLPTINNFFDKS
jgi:ParB family chromosome partitioning protein